MRKILTLFITLFALYAVGQTPGYVVKVGDFNELKVAQGVNVDYKFSTDSAGMAIFSTADSSVVRAVVFQTKKNRLTIGYNDARKVPAGVLPRVTVYSKTLVSIENQSDSTVRVLGMANVPEFKARQCGSGRLALRGVDCDRANIILSIGAGAVTATGKCNQAKLSLAGSGSMVADELVASDVVCSITGAGTIGCCAESTLKIKGMGSGTVYYSGNPKITVNSLGLNIEKL